jgi:outer membrane biosynthesis protein TonB
MAVWLQQPNEKTAIVPFYGTINGVIPVTKAEEKEPDPEPEQQPEPEPEPLPEQQPEPEPAPEPQSEMPTRPDSRPNPQSEIPNPKSVIPASQTIHIVDYSDKAIAVFGSTRQFKDEFLKIWGRWIPVTNPATGTKSKAWVFSRKRKAQVEQIIKAA